MNIMDLNNNISEKYAIKINDIEPDINQPRKIFDDEALAELASSIKQYGVTFPLPAISSKVKSSSILLHPATNERAIEAKIIYL